MMWGVDDGRERELDSVGLKHATVWWFAAGSWHGGGYEPAQIRHHGERPCRQAHVLTPSTGGWQPPPIHLPILTPPE